MFDIFINECRRYRLTAILSATLMMIALATHSAMQPIMHNDFEVVAITLLVMLLSFAFGCFQLWMHKRDSHWTFLVHRPLSTKQIFVAISGSAMTVISCAVTIPFLLLFAGLDLMNIELVESRHYLFAVHITLLAWFSYFVAMFTILNSSWLAILSFALAFMLLSDNPIPAWQIFVTDITCLALVGYLAMRSFKVDLKTHLSTKKEIFAVAFVSQMGLFGLLLTSQMFFYHFPLMFLDKHPDNFKKEQLTNYYAELWKLEPEELINTIVDESKFSEKEHLASQISLAKVLDVHFRFEPTSILGQLFHQDNSYMLSDSKNNTNWFFSHNDKVFIGKHRKSNEVVGYLTPTEFLPADADLTSLSARSEFTSVPFTYGENFIQVQDTLYIVDFDDQYIEIKHQLDEGEYYTRPVQRIHDSPYSLLISNKAMYLFDTRQFNQVNVVTEPSHRIAHYREFSSTVSVDLYSLVDGFIVHYYSTHFFGYNKPGTAMVYARHNNEQQLIGEKSYLKARPLPYWISEQPFWMSSIMFGVGFDYLKSLYRQDNDPRKRTLSQLLSRKHNDQVYIWLIASWLITCIFTWILASKLKITQSKKFYWLFIVWLFGLPGFVTFILMHRWRERRLFKKIQSDELESYSAAATNRS